LQQSSILLLVGEGDLVLGVDLLVFGTVAVEQAFLLSLYVHQAQVGDLLLVGQNVHVLDEFGANVHAYFRDRAMAYTCQSTLVVRFLSTNSVSLVLISSFANHPGLFKLRDAADGLLVARTGRVNA